MELYSMVEGLGTDKIVGFINGVPVVSNPNVPKDIIYVLDEKSFAKIIIKRPPSKGKIHKVGEHGAVGLLTKKGLICAECSKKIKK